MMKIKQWRRPGKSCVSGTAVYANKHFFLKEKEREELAFDVQWSKQRPACSPFSASQSHRAVECTDSALFGWNLVVWPMSIPQLCTQWPLTSTHTHTNTYTHIDTWGFLGYTVYNIIQSDGTLCCRAGLGASFSSPNSLLQCVLIYIYIYIHVCVCACAPLPAVYRSVSVRLCMWVN